MDDTADWQANSDDSARADRPKRHVQAWARDSSTGEPVYIRELGPQRLASKCGCECQSCDLPLTAVNAAKSEYINRPHFRHPTGAEKSECLFLAARLAALQLLRDQGVFELPARKVLGKFVGLSGMQHEVWFEHPAERLKIRDFDFRDKAWALITFDDGRQLRFQLIGSSSIDKDGQVIPSISLDLNDAELAGLSLKELRKRVTLLPDFLCWHSHWKDSELQTQANEAASAKAFDLLDTEGEYSHDLSGIDQNCRRESLLHLEVKKILSQACHIRVPEIQCYELRTADDGYEIEKSIDFPSVTIPLTDVVLEKRFGRLIPDVTARTTKEHGRVLLIEVTVTNTIDRARQGQIRANNTPTIEIDLSRVGGLISRSELKELVISDIECKRWLCHPMADLCQQELESAANAELLERNLAIRDQEEERLSILKISVFTIAKEYLHAIERHEAAARLGRIEDFDEISQLLAAITFHAKKLAIHGFPEANEHELFGSRSQIIPTILAIKYGGGVGYELVSTMGTMNAIKQSQVHNRKLHTIYLIAFSVYQKLEALNPPDWYQTWLDEIKESIHAGEKTYVRLRKYDQLLSLLFPEMAMRLSKTFGTEDYAPSPKTRSSRQRMKRRYSEGNDSPFESLNLSDSKDSYLLKGPELEQWKKNNPTAARNFFGNTGEKKDDEKST